MRGPGEHNDALSVCVKDVVDKRFYIADYPLDDVTISTDSDESSIAGFYCE